MIERKPLQIQAYDHLKGKILNGELAFDTLYSETKLAKDMGISRTPMRDAIQYLAQERYIDILPNKGFYLHKMSMADFMETFQVRCAIEGYAARALCQQQDGATMAKLRQALHAQETAQSPEEFLTADTDFHHSLVDFLGNSEFSNWFEIHMYQMSKLAKTSIEHPGRMPEALAEHTAILDAIQSGNKEQAYEAVMRHMENPKNISLNDQD